MNLKDINEEHEKLRGLLKDLNEDVAKMLENLHSKQRSQRNPTPTRENVSQVMSIRNREF